MNTLWLIRHGRTPANDAHLYCGSTDIGLSEAGRAELRTLHYDISPEQFLTSGMKRTEETLRLLFGEVPHGTEPALREIDFGKFEMHAYEEIRNDPDYIAWCQGDNDANVSPGGESGNQMTARVLPALHRLLNCGRSTLVVTHGGVIAAAMAALFPEEGKSRYDWQPRPGHGYEISGGTYRPIP